MTDMDFDKCPTCGSFGIYGLRCHPKWSIKVGHGQGENAEMSAFYSHSEAGIRAIRNAFTLVPDAMFLSEIEHWDGTTWVEMAR